MTASTRTGARLFELLPDYVRAADTSGELAEWLGAIGDAAAGSEWLLDNSDPDTSGSGASEPVDPAYTPAAWLSWLGGLVGVPVAQLSTANARWLLGQQGSMVHGSAAGIKAAVRSTLSGTRDCVVTTNVGGDPWAITVTVKADEVEDSLATIAAATREKPAGAAITVTTASAVSYDDLATAYTTYADMTTTALTYDELRLG